MPGPRTTTALLLTDIGGSTRMWRVDRDAMDAAVKRYVELVDEAVAAHGGWRPIDQGEGDSTFTAFDAAGPAVEAALAVQLAFEREPWPTAEPLRVRIGVHVGDVVRRAGNLLGEAVSRCARLRDSAHPGQIVVSSVVESIVGTDLPPGVTLRDLGEHRLPDLVRAERVFQLCHPDLPGEFPRLRSLDAAPNNLPVQLSSFVGRARDIDAVTSLVREHRLVTLTGFGGIGKTRLALHVAARLAASGVDGAYFVDLSALRDPALILDAVGSALDVRPGETSALLPALATRLAGDHVLLVLDNLEQVIDAAASVLDLLHAAPDLHVLATSRQPLRLRGEHEYALEPLGVPEEGAGGDVLETFESVQLFIERAGDAVAGFEVDNESAPAVAAICARLDGLPLAIELAAARVRSLPPRALLARLTARLDLPGAGASDLPGRHRTLRATIEWSHDLLDPDEQSLLAALSVFSGGASLEAAEAVCGGDCRDVLGVLSSLVEKSLVRQRAEGGGDPRFAMFRTVAAFAAERLAERPDVHRRVADRHADHFRDTVAALVVGRLTEQAAVDYVQRELDNLRVALDHLRATGRTEEEAQLLADIADPVWHRGHWDELIRRSLDVLDRTSSPSETTFTLLDCVAVGSLSSDLDRAEQWSRRAIATAMEIGRPLLEARSWFWLGHLHQVRGQLDCADDAVRRALDLVGSAGDESPRYGFYRRDVVLCEGTAIEAGLAVRRAQWDAAAAAAGRAVELAERLGDPDSRIRGHARRGAAALGAGRLDDARADLADAVNLCRGSGVRGYLPLLLAQLADVERRRGDIAGAHAALDEARSVAAELGVVEALVELVAAESHLDHGDPTAARAALDRVGDAASGEKGARRALVAGRIALAADDHPAAREQAGAGLRLCLAEGLFSGVSPCLRLAALAAADPAARDVLLSAAAAHEHDSGPVLLRGLVPAPAATGPAAEAADRPMDDLVAIVATGVIGRSA